ncbi:hypothetical protein Vi05172_g404 [Venturia inaequalis]|nr:hypothetical protein Vi05172_g404 [Venturia inaequalis]
MTPTPPSSTSSNTGQSPDGQFRVVRKRNRIPLSCGPCRHRKLKCNRGHPCDNCTKRGDLDSCSYASPGARKKSSTPNGAAGTPDEMQNRIDRLEGLVLSLMTNGSQSAGPAAASAAIAGAGSSMSGSSQGFPRDVDSIQEEPEGNESEVDQVTKSIGIMKVDSGRNIFASEAHWYSILAEISEVKTYFQDHKKQFEVQYNRVKQNTEQANGGSSGLLFQTVKPATLAEIQAEFPAKVTTDVLISRFFNTYNYDPAFHIIHGPTYQKQYDQHWANPTETPVVWLAMSFAMMVIAVQSYHRSQDEPPEYRGRTEKMLADYRRLTAQCLVLADVTQPINYMLETLLLYVIAEFGRSRDAEGSVLLGVSIIVRLAMRMGYHRDSKDYPAITTFNGEMRRRIWSVIRQSDILFSNQVGLPPMIRPNDTNTALPINIYDDELIEDMKALPPARPINETTPMTYVIYKAQLINLFSEIVDSVQTLHPTSYEEAMKLDHKLREIHSNIPTVFKMRAIEESLRDPAALVMQRYILDLLFLKSQCVLHRKFICPSRESPRYVYSRRTSVDNAVEMLRHQATLHNESRPGGRLSNVKWFISSLTSNDFLLAAMIVALDLHHSAEIERTGRRSSNDVYDWTHERRASMLAALELSRSIWESLSDQSLEALKANGLLTAMLSRLQEHEAQIRQQISQGFTPPSRFSQNGANGDDTKLAPEHSAAMTLGMLSTGALTPDATNMFAQYPNSAATMNGHPVSSGLTPQPQQFSSAVDNGPVSAPSPFSFFGSQGFLGMEVPGNNIDWDAWDSYVQTSTVDPNTSNLLWPGGMNMDAPSPNPLMDGLDASSHAQNGQQASTAGPVNGFSMSGNVFMGVGTPPRNSMI